MVNRGYVVMSRGYTPPAGKSANPAEDRHNGSGINLEKSSESTSWEATNSVEPDTFRQLMQSISVIIEWMRATTRPLSTTEAFVADISASRFMVGPEQRPGHGEFV